jgi:hypothetical protein
VGHAGTASAKLLLAIGAVLAAALLAGCGGSNDKGYSIGSTEQCLRGNVSLIWATGGAEDVLGPDSDEVKTVEQCLKA